MDNDKTDKNIFKFSKRFYFQVLIFLVVACVHFLITPMFEVDIYSPMNETLMDFIHAVISIALSEPGRHLILLVSTTFNTPYYFELATLISSLTYGVIVSLLFSEKIYLKVISTFFIIMYLFLAYVAVTIFIPMSNALMN